MASRAGLAGLLTSVQTENLLVDYMKSFMGSGVG